MTSSTGALMAAGGVRLELAEIVDTLASKFAVVTGAKQLVRRAHLDTFDRRLSSAGLTLEHHLLRSGQRLVLRQPDGTALVAAPMTNLQWPAMADALPAGPIRDTITPVIDVRALTVISRERRNVRRLDLHNADTKTVARVEFDEPAPAANDATAAPPQAIVRALRGYDHEARLATRLLTGLGLRETKHDKTSSDAPSARTDRAAPASELLTTGLRSYLVTAAVGSRPSRSWAT